MRLPTNRPPAHPGDVLLEDCIKPTSMIKEAAERLHIPRVRLSEIVNRRRSVTPDTAVRLARLFGTDAEFWLNLQTRWDLWHTLQDTDPDEIEAIRPVEERSNDGGAVEAAHA